MQRTTHVPSRATSPQLGTGAPSSRETAGTSGLPTDPQQPQSRTGHRIPALIQTATTHAPRQSSPRLTAAQAKASAPDIATNQHSPPRTPPSGAVDALPALSESPGPLQDLRREVFRLGMPNRRSDVLVAERDERGEWQLCWRAHDADAAAAPGWQARKMLRDRLNEAIAAMPGATDETIWRIFPEQGGNRFRQALSRPLSADEVLGIVGRVESLLRRYGNGSPAIESPSDDNIEPLTRFLQSLPRDSFLAGTDMQSGTRFESRLEPPDDPSSEVARKAAGERLRKTQAGICDMDPGDGLRTSLDHIAAALETDPEPLMAAQVNEAVLDSARAAHASLLKGRFEPAADGSPAPTPTEALASLLVELDKARESVSPEQRETIEQLDRKVKRQWLARGGRFPDAILLCSTSARVLSANGLQEAARAASQLAEGLGTPAARWRTRLMNNEDGRALERNFANALNEAPSPAMVQAAADVGIALADTLARLPAREQAMVVGDTYRRLHEQYPRNWTVVADHDKGIAGDVISQLMTSTNPDLDGLRKALTTPVSTGDDCLCIQQLLSAVGSALGHHSDEAPWAKRATRNAAEAIGRIDVRGALKYFDAPVDRTEGSGILLRHQGPARFGRQSSRREAVQRVFDLDAPTRPQRVALSTGRPLASGVSTTAGLALNLFRHLEEHPGPALSDALQRSGRRAFDLKAAFLDHLKWLVHDGGHSIHEALWTANQSAEALGIEWLGPRQPAQDFESDYERYFDSLPAELSAHVDRALDQAFDQLIQDRRGRSQRPAEGR